MRAGQTTLLGHTLFDNPLPFTRCRAMPIELLSESERAKLSRFPEEIPLEDLQRHFTLSDEDIRVVERRRLDSNRLGFSLALLALRYLGFFPPISFKGAGGGSSVRGRPDRRRSQSPERVRGETEDSARASGAGDGAPRSTVNA